MDLGIARGEAVADDQAAGAHREGGASAAPEGAEINLLGTSLGVY